MADTKDRATGVAVASENTVSKPTDSNGVEKKSKKQSLNLIEGASSEKERKRRRERAQESVKPLDTEKGTDENHLHIPTTIKAGLFIMAYRNWRLNKNMEKLGPYVARVQKEIAKNQGDPYQRIRKEQLLEEAMKKQRKMEKRQKRAQHFYRILGTAINATSTMARTTLMGAGAGIIRADDKGATRDVIPTIATPRGGQQEEPSMDV